MPSTLMELLVNCLNEIEEDLKMNFLVTCVDYKDASVNERRQVIVGTLK